MNHASPHGDDESSYRLCEWASNHRQAALEYAAKAMALGADAVYVGTSALIALNCNRDLYREDYAAIGAAPGHCHHCHTGRCPVGITTQDADLMARLGLV